MLHFGLIPTNMKAAFDADAPAALRELRQLGYQSIESGNIAEHLGGADVPAACGLSLNWDDLPGTWDYLSEGGSWDPSGMHASLDEKIAAVQHLGGTYLVLYWGPSESREQMVRLAAILDAIGERVAAAGLRFCYHNHDHEFKAVFDGVRGHDLLVAACDPERVSFQLDLGWVRYGGEDPAACIRRLAGRVPTVHLRDVATLAERGCFAIPGTGILDMAELWQACSDSGVEYIIFEPHKVATLQPMQVNAATAWNLRALGLVE